VRTNITMPTCLVRAAANAHAVVRLGRRRSPTVWTMLAVGFCGTVTNFALFMENVFAAFSNLDAPGYGRFSGVSTVPSCAAFWPLRTPDPCGGPAPCSLPRGAPCELLFGPITPADQTTFALPFTLLSSSPDSRSSSSPSPSRSRPPRSAFPSTPPCPPSSAGSSPRAPCRPHHPASRSPPPSSAPSSTPAPFYSSHSAPTPGAPAPRSRSCSPRSARSSASRSRGD